MEDEDGEDLDLRAYGQGSSTAFVGRKTTSLVGESSVSNEAVISSSSSSSPVFETPLAPVGSVSSSNSSQLKTVLPVGESCRPAKWTIFCVAPSSTFHLVFPLCTCISYLPNICRKSFQLKTKRSFV